MTKDRLGATIYNILESAPAAQAKNTNIAAGGRELPKRKSTNDSNFLGRAEALRKKIKARTGAKFDVSALIRESRQRHSLKEENKREE